MKVLVLDHDPQYLSSLRRLGVDVVNGKEAFTPGSFGIYTVSNQTVSEMLMEHRPDIVVVGDNPGSRESIAEVLPPHLKARTVVVWVSGLYDHRREGSYREKGISRFCRRSSIEGGLRKLIAEIVAAEGDSAPTTDKVLYWDESGDGNM